MTNIVGIDPGPLVGVCLLRLPSPAGRAGAYTAQIAQCTPNALWALIAAWQEAYTVDAVAGERFVIGPRASRVNAPQATAEALKILGQLHIAVPVTVRRILRSASEVKQWATDARLTKAGLWTGKGMGHAHDAVRHALFAAVKDYGAPDPFSRKASVAVLGTNNV